MTRVALLGLGRMGARIAMRIAGAGHELSVSNRTAAASEAFPPRARACREAGVDRAGEPRPDRQVGRRAPAVHGRQIVQDHYTLQARSALGPRRQFVCAGADATLSNFLPVGGIFLLRVAGLRTGAWPGTFAVF